MHPGLEELAEALRAQAGPQVAAALCRLLRPLRDYDARTRSDLGATLRAHVESGSVTETAERLFLHRNSVQYRLRRIEELSGIDARDGRTRLVLLVAFALTDPTLLETGGDIP